MAKQGIIPIELELTKGTAYTLFAPAWREGNAEWQAVLGAGEDAYLFESAAELLAFLNSGAKHDFTSHPAWARFKRDLPASVLTEPRDCYDVVGLPALLAGKADYNNVSSANRIFAITRAIGAIADIQPINRMFASNSILAATENGAEHFQGAAASQWSAIGRVIVANWDDCVDGLDELWGKAPEVSAEAISAAESQLKEAREVQAERRAAIEKERAQKEKSLAEAAAAADPYDSTVWAKAGIDPIKISINGRTLYTLRCYLGGRPLFLGHAGEIHTFSQPRTLVRWLIENSDHDLSRLVTWDEVISAANAGELEVSVHSENEYSFAGLVEDIKQGPVHVDAAQLSRAYELLADAADWSGDDAVNEVLAANQQLQWLLNYLLDTGELSEPVPPFDDEAKAWAQLESDLIARFTTKV